MKSNIKLKIISTILITIILSVLVSVSRPKKDHSKLMHDWFWVNKTHFSEKASILILGDSRIYRGIPTSPIKKVCPNHKIINLGYSSGGLNKEVFDFALNYFDTTKTVKIIVIGVSPYSLTAETRKNEHLLQELNRPFAEIIERKYVNPFFTGFESIKWIDYKSSDDKVYYYRKFYKDGWIKSHKEPFDVEEALGLYKLALSNTKLSEISIQETLDFVDEMNQKGVKVYGFRPPSTKKMETLENEILRFDEEEIMKLFQNNGGEWIDIPNRFSFNSYDGSHLHFTSAKRLSKYIAKKIK